jgi:uncharacterized coiled-coil protein SlyX
MATAMERIAELERRVAALEQLLTEPKRAEEFLPPMWLTKRDDQGAPS